MFKKLFTSKNTNINSIQTSLDDFNNGKPTFDDLLNEKIVKNRVKNLNTRKLFLSEYNISKTVSESEEYYEYSKRLFCSVVVAPNKINKKKFLQKNIR
jgi:hypothetical protein